MENNIVFIYKKSIRKAYNDPPTTSYNSFYRIVVGLPTTRKHHQRCSVFYMDGHGAQLRIDQFPVYRDNPFVGKPWVYPNAPNSKANPENTWFWKGSPAPRQTDTTLDL